jgi:hypothetical protein
MIAAIRIIGITIHGFQQGSQTQGTQIASALLKGIQILLALE